MEEVSREEVIDSWLRRDIEEHGDKDVQVDDLNESEKVDKLMYLNEESASFMEDRSFRWYKTELPRECFLQTYHIWEGFDVPESTVGELGKKLNCDKPEVQEPMEDSDIDLDAIREIADNYPEKTAEYPLIVTKERSIWKIRDGNHRAMGLSLHMAQGGDYKPEKAYIGFKKNQDLFERIRDSLIRFSEFFRNRFRT
ncbi:MAG: hypothetical protein ABEK01_05570 [Candidatus Nanohaloarchaea archaeon]